MLTSVATVLHKTHRKWGVNREMEGWETEGGTELLLVLMMTSMLAVMNDWDYWKALLLSTQRPCTACRSRARAPPPSGRDCRQ